jgi:HEAT repeat protein
MVVGWAPMPSALPEVRRLLGASVEGPAIRTRAARAIENYQDSESIPVLLGVLNDPSFEVVAAAMRALGAISDQRAFGALSLEVSNASGPRLVVAAVALGRQAVADACSPLLAARQRTEWEKPHDRAQLAVAMLSSLSRPCVDEAFVIGEGLKSDSQAVSFFASAASRAFADGRRLHPMKAAAIDAIEAEFRRRFPPV